MPQRPDISRDQPSFFRFPLNNNRTGFQPVFLPLVLVEPRKRTPAGATIDNSHVILSRFFISDAPQPARVAGPFNTGLLIPRSDVFTLDVSSIDLNNARIDVSSRQFTSPDGQIKDFDDAQEDDTFEYTLTRNNVSSQIPFFSDADYYDLSEFVIDVNDLPAPERYFFVWEVSYFRRILDPAGQFVCISEQESISQLKLEINHPGDVHYSIFKSVPSLYLDAEASELSEDSTLKFVRPFADALQDIFDEQSLIEGINHIDRIPAQLIPYLAFLIGWDLPNYPGVSDNVRRSVLKSAVQLQKLKGSRRTLIELFDILGFSIEILNLWFSTDGSRLIAPGESLPQQFNGQEIESETVCRTEVLVADFDESGFGELEIPLMHRPTSNISLDAWLVSDPSTMNTALNNAANSITDDPDEFESSICATASGFLVPQALLDALPSASSLATSQVLVDLETGRAIDEIQTGTEPPLGSVNITFDKEKNLLNLNFDHHLSFDNSKLFVFATYQYTKITVPDVLGNLRSNRFDIRILVRDSGEPPSQEILSFLLNFVFRLKAFHSLLRKLIFTLEIPEVYNVTDFCLCGDVEQCISLDAGQLQVPPAILPTDLTEQPDCDEDSVAHGFRDSDRSLRAKIINGLKIEHEAWKSLDDTHQQPDPVLESLARVSAGQPEGTECQFTQLGQDRVELGEFDPDHESDTRAKVCDDSVVPLPDNCFKGRVNAVVDPDLILSKSEIAKCKICLNSVGDGIYYLMPPLTGDIIDGQSDSQFLGRLLRQYDDPQPQTIHFTNRRYFADRQGDPNAFLALQRPSLAIEKDNWGFPGHRPPSLTNFVGVFTHPEFRAKPWDEQFSSITCARNLVEENLLNARLEEDSEGNEHIIFDGADLVYEGNGIEADISSFSEHDDRSFKTTHKIFMVASPSHPAIELDEDVVLTSETSIEFDSDVEFDPLFSSFNPECNQDFIDGYPAVCGRFDIDEDSILFDRDPDSGTEPDSLTEALGLPVPDSTGLTALFTFGTQILLDRSDPEFRFYEPMRFDCGCTQFDCGDTDLTSITAGAELGILQCVVDKYLTDPAETNCDRFSFDIDLLLKEDFGVCSTKFDGSITTMCLLEEDSAGNLTIPDDLPASGNFIFVDDYDVIYEISFETSGNRIDITVITKDPRVWGQPPSGFVGEGRRVFKDGTITICREIVEVQDDGSIVVIGRGCEQEIGLVQTNFVCGDVRPFDNFCYRFNCGTVDEFGPVVICGPRWADIEVSDDSCVEWSPVAADGSIVPSANTQPFAFIDVWGAPGTDITCLPC